MFTKDNLNSFVRSLDVRIILIILLIAVSTGHVGRLFADREDGRQAFVGYVLALSIDGVMAVSLYELSTIRTLKRKLFALFVFVCSCGVSGAFNYVYYRTNYPNDPELISGALGLAAPVLAALLSVLKAFGDSQRTQAEQAEQEAERSLELEKYRIAQTEQTQRELNEQTEQTKRVRAEQRSAQKIAQLNAQTEQAKADAVKAVEANVSERQANGERLKPGELDKQVEAILVVEPEIGPRPLARKLDVSPSTAAGILKRVRDNGKEN